MTEIKQGRRVRARTADDSWVTLRATTGVEPGQDFPVVWVLEEDQWEAALAGQTNAQEHALPWPAEDVEPLKAGDA
jgi:hypothetical protein